MLSFRDLKIIIIRDPKNEVIWSESVNERKLKKEEKEGRGST